MEHSNVILVHTRNLLKHDVFNHLNDDLISVIHHRILQSPSKEIDKRLFFKLWRNGDYGLNSMTIQLLQKTNYLLQTFGEPLIEEDFLELAYD